MQEIEGDIWTVGNGHTVVITTNGFVKKDGSAVMGRGIALQAAKRFPDLKWVLGGAIKAAGNHTLWLGEYKDEHGKYEIISLPVKHNWWEKADIHLIERSLTELVNAVIDNTDSPIYLVRPGCGNGQLNWINVKPIVELYLSDRFIVVNQ